MAEASDGKRDLFCTTDSPDQTEALAEELARVLVCGDVVALDGELGAGKTVFVRGLARGLDVEEPVSSPTYTLHHEYPGRLTLHHFDAWMQGRELAFLEDGGAELLGTEGVTVVEWASRIREALPRPFLEVVLKPAAGGADRRRLSLAVVGSGPSAMDLIQRAGRALEAFAAKENPERPEAH